MIVTKLSTLLLLMLSMLTVANSAQGWPYAPIHHSDSGILFAPAAQETDSTQSSPDSTEVDDEQLDQEIEGLLSDSTDSDDESIDDLEEEDTD